MIEIKCTKGDKERIIWSFLTSHNCPLPPDVECKSYQGCKKCLDDNIKWNLEREDN